MIKRKIKLIDFLRYLAMIFRSFLLLLLPRNILIRKTNLLLSKIYNIDFSNILYFKSGRSALTSLFQAILEKEPSGIILLPDYICNVVFTSASFSRIEYKIYHTNEYFEPDFDEIKLFLSEKNVSAILFASILGSQNNNTDIITLIRKFDPSVVFIFDECQNIKSNPHLELDTKSVIVLSFNKSTHGEMGGALCFKDDFLTIPDPSNSFFQNIKLEFIVIGMVVHHSFIFLYKFLVQFFISNNLYQVPKLEYSSAKNQYSVEIQHIAKISICRAIVGLEYLNQFEKQRMNNSLILQDYIKFSRVGQIIETKNAQTSLYLPFYILDKSIFGKIPLKGPYAKNDSSSNTNRPDLFCVINDGFSHFAIEDRYLQS